MFGICQNKRIPSLCLILIGLGIILLIPKLASADNQPTMYSIDTTAHAEFYCADCFTVVEEAPVAHFIASSTGQFDPCDICFTEQITYLEENVAWANEVEEALYTASIQAIIVQQDELSDHQQNKINTAIDLLAQAKTQLDDGAVGQAELLLEQANDLLADVDNEHHLSNSFSMMFMPIVLFNATTSKSSQHVLTENYWAGLFIKQNGQSWSINTLENHLFNQVSTEALCHRGPPTDEDALILANTKLWFT